MSDKTAQSPMDEALTVAATELIAELLADAKKAWAKEMEIMAAESRAIIAEMRADLAEHKLAVTQIKAGAKRS